MARWWLAVLTCACLGWAAPAHALARPPSWSLKAVTEDPVSVPQNAGGLWLRVTGNQGPTLNDLAKLDADQRATLLKNIIAWGDPEVVDASKFARATTLELVHDQLWLSFEPFESGAYSLQSLYHSFNDALPRQQAITVRDALPPPTTLGTLDVTVMCDLNARAINVSAQVTYDEEAQPYEAVLAHRITSLSADSRPGPDLGFEAGWRAAHGNWSWRSGCASNPSTGDLPEGQYTLEVESALGKLDTELPTLTTSFEVSCASCAFPAIQPTLAGGTGGAVTGGAGGNSSSGSGGAGGASAAVVPGPNHRDSNCSTAPRPRSAALLALLPLLALLRRRRTLALRY